MSLRRCASLGSVLMLTLSLLAGAPAPAHATGPFPLGTVTENPIGDPQCPAGHTCSRLTITCPDVTKTIEARYSVSPPQATVRGTIVLFSGGSGSLYWQAGNPDAAAFVDRLWQVHGFQVVQVRWIGNWAGSDPGEQIGPAKLACRPATAIGWIHDHVANTAGYAPQPTDGVCGFCLVGGSGGSGQVAYALSHYGLDSIVNGVFPVGGPTHAAIAKGCLRNPAEDLYWYLGSDFDSAYGFSPNAGPCAAHDVSWKATWDRDSVDTQGSDYTYEHSRVNIVVGETDIQRSRARDYVQRLALAGSPFVTFHVIAGMGHALDANGTAALEAELVWTAGHGETACSNGVDDDFDGTTDAGADPGCASASDISEHNPLGPVCDDGLDQDGDGRPDAPVDQGCTGPTDTSEDQAGLICDDGLDNDNDGRADFPADLGCTSNVDGKGTGGAEHHDGRVCDDGQDNDHDGLRDFRLDGTGDPGCASGDDTTEENGTGGGGPVFAALNATATEVDTGATSKCRVKVTLNPAATSMSSVQFATANGTATAGQDYGARSGSISLAAGTTQKTITIVVTGDTLDEPNETFTLTLSNPSAGTSISATQGTATCTIKDDD